MDFELDSREIMNLDKTSELIIVDGEKVINDLRTNCQSMTVVHALSQQYPILPAIYDMSNSNINTNMNMNNKETQISDQNDDHKKQYQKTRTRHRYESNSCTWTKITTTNKYKLIGQFIDNLSITDKRSKANLLYLLTCAIDQHKITKNIDVDYDITLKQLKGIYKLYVCDDEEYKLSETNLESGYVQII